MMYDELIKNLRNCSEINSLSRYKRDLMEQAADAIKELVKENESLAADLADSNERRRILLNANNIVYISFTERG